MKKWKFFILYTDRDMLAVQIIIKNFKYDIYFKSGIHYFLDRVSCFNTNIYSRIQKVTKWVSIW